MARLLQPLVQPIVNGMHPIAAEVSRGVHAIVPHRGYGLRFQVLIGSGTPWNGYPASDVNGTADPFTFTYNGVTQTIEELQVRVDTRLLKVRFGLGVTQLGGGADGITVTALGGPKSRPLPYLVGPNYYQEADEAFVAYVESRVGLNQLFIIEPATTADLEAFNP